MDRWPDGQMAQDRRGLQGRHAEDQADHRCFRGGQGPAWKAGHDDRVQPTRSDHHGLAPKVEARRCSKWCVTDPHVLSHTALGRFPQIESLLSRATFAPLDELFFEYKKKQFVRWITVCWITRLKKKCLRGTIESEVMLGVQVQSVAFDSQWRRIAAGCADGKLRVFKCASKLIEAVPGPAQTCPSCT